MLAARDLAFGHRGRAVGRGLELAVERGQVTCILGPNGAGKTTLVRTLLGLVPPLAGSVVIDGRDLAALARRDVARAVAYVPQGAWSPFDFTLLEIVEMGRSAHYAATSHPGPRDRAAARAALERMGIAALGERSIGEVSGGERQLALIARALASEAPALVMDEPTAGLDFGNQARVLDQVARLREGGASILFSTHDPDHAFRVADRVILLRDGRILAQGSVGEALTSENLTLLYGVSVHVAQMDTPAGPRRVCVPAPVSMPRDRW